MFGSLAVCHPVLTSSCRLRGVPRAAKAEQALVTTSNPALRFVWTLPKHPPYWKLDVAGAVAEAERFGHVAAPAAFVLS